MAKTLKVAVVGMGHGRAHVRVFNEYIDQTEVVMVCDVVEERARSAAEEHGIGKWTIRYADVLAEKDVDLVALCTPCHLHGQHTLAALDHWKHVMVEVPMENQSLETLWKIVYMSERRNLKVQMDNQLRWMAPTVHMKRLIEQGKLGEIYYVETEYVHDIEGITIRQDGSPTFRWGLGELAQGSISAGGGLYAIDNAYWLMGEQFVEVFGYGNKKNMPYRQVYDHEVALFKTASGAIARCVCSKGPKRPTIEYAAVYGTKGTLETSGRLPHPPDGPGVYGCFADEDPNYSRGVYGWMYTMSVKQEDEAAKEQSEHGMVKIEVPPLIVDEEISGRVGHGGTEYLADLDLVNAILEDYQPPCNVYESARSCAGAICAVQSIYEGRPVQVPDIVDRSDAVKRFGPLPTAHQNSDEL
ncbi:MAG: Gfo/Idh/MocA family oxidoreductase [Gemmatimonadetes bacterium]|nr:Gfo/Idh/MocA family oxidoreductase [Gemmatimonadota bacterium]